MIIVAAALLGALLGYQTARKRGGAPLDIAQYAAGYAIAFSLAGLLLTVFLARMS